jgi:hypothetical protein
VKQDAICAERPSSNSGIYEKLTIAELKKIKYLSGSSNNQPLHMIGVGNVKFLQICQFQIEESK